MLRRWMPTGGDETDSLPESIGTGWGNETDTPPLQLLRQSGRNRVTGRYLRNITGQGIKIARWLRPTACPTAWAGAPGPTNLEIAP